VSPILSLLAEEYVGDILLNPDSSLWVKLCGTGFVRWGTMLPATAASALGPWWPGAAPC
jgi:hypothetical protein